MSYFPTVQNLLAKRLSAISQEINSITNEINKHSDLKALMNNYTVTNAGLLLGLSQQLVELEAEGREINKVFRALVNGASILEQSSHSSINFYLVELFDRLPKHIQEEWKDNFDHIHKQLEAGKGLR